MVKSPRVSNEAVLESKTPKVEGLEFEALADNYAQALRIKLISIITIVLIPNLVFSFFNERFYWLLSQWWLYGIYLSAVGLVFFLGPIIAQSRGFALREKDIHYKSGIIWKKTVSLPFNRIQHVELESGPIERIFKLTTLKFFSAGGSKADMKIPALPFERSKSLRAYVVQKAGVENVGAEAS